MKNNISKLLIIALCTIFMTGCWDNVEINDRHVVLELALDKNDNKEQSAIAENVKDYKVTYTIPDSAKLSGAQSLSDNIKTTFVVNAATIAKSVEAVENKTQNTISFSHIKAILFGEELMKDKALFKGAVEGLLRNIEIGQGTELLAVEGEAGDISKAENYQNPIVGLYIMKYFNNKEREVGYAQERILGEAVKDLEETGVTTIPRIANNKEESAFEIQGAAVIKDYSFAGWLDKEEVRGKTFIDGQIKNNPIVVWFNDNYVVYQIKDESCKMDFYNAGEKLKVRFNIEAEGNILEYANAEELGDMGEQELKQINELIEQEIRRQIELAITKEKEIKTDFLKIGLNLYRKEPKIWRKYSYIWENDNYNNIDIQLNVNNNIRSSGMMQ